MSNVCTHGLSLDEPCVRCELQKPTAMPESVATFAPDNYKQAYSHGMAAERSRCRSIILKHLSNDWTANKVLEEIDNA